MKKLFLIIWLISLIASANLSAAELYSWGLNSNGQLGDNSTINRTSPVKIGSSSDWKSVNCGLVHNAAIKNDGTLWTWGFNSKGQLGDGTTTDEHSPVKVGSDNNWMQVSCGWLHTVALKSDGTLWAWGDNFWGQLGDGTKTNKSSPVKIGNSNDWTYVATGEVHTFAIKKDGTLWAWGDNQYGKLGDGTEIDKVSPVKIGNDNKWYRISAGGGHTIALKTDNTLWGWGFNFWGQVGNNSTTDQYSPVQIGTDNDWNALDCGKHHTLAIKSNGTLWAWGYNGQGRLGDGTNSNRHSPVQIGNETNWVFASAGELHSIGFKNEGSIWTWGYNNIGQLGDGTTIDRYAPVKVGNSYDWINVSCGTRYSVCLFGATPPEITTNNISDITDVSALCGANVISDGGRPVSSRGVCWSILENPTIADNYVLSGNGIGEFTGLVSGLANNTKYYVRAFAINSVGTSYGEQKSFETYLKHVIPLKAGWNLISTFVEPANSAMENIWKDVKNDVVIVKNNSGNTYIPEWDIDDIHTWNYKEGYQVYSKNSVNLTISGIPVIPELTDVSLPQGWSIISYLRNEPLSAINSLNTITNNDALIIAKNNDGQTYIPEWDINDIGNMNPGEGYQVYLSKSANLTYPKNKVIETVIIGNQVWMKHNLDVTHYNNGDPIRHTFTQAEWIDAANKKQGAWCYWGNDPENGELYGKLYNWYAVTDQRGLAPEGFHIPTDAEWNVLEEFLGGKFVAGGKMKQSGTEIWYAPNTGATNSSGFTGLPGGHRNESGSFQAIKSTALWWSVSESNENFGWYRYIRHDSATLYRGDWYKSSGFSVRCIKD